MSTRLRFLTFAWQLPYLRALARVGHRWDVIARRQHHVEQPWMLARELPANATVARASTALARAARGGYDLVVCHTWADFVATAGLPVPRVMVLHDGPAISTALGLPGTPLAAHLAELASTTPCVFDGEALRSRWDLPGRVITPGLAVTDYPAHEGDRAVVVVQTNLASQLGPLAGLQMLEHVTAGLPVVLLGLDPRLGRTREATEVERRDAFAHGRVYLNIAPPSNADCPSLAMLEAMASGMPVVTTPVADGPVVDGVNGFVDESDERLRCCLLELLEDRERALALGQAARETVRAQYPADRFWQAWEDVIAEYAAAPRAYETRRAGNAPAA